MRRRVSFEFLIWVLIAQAIFGPIPIPGNSYALAGEENGNAINLSLFTPQYLSCGSVSVNGVVTTDDDSQITGLTWEWGDSLSNLSWFPATHQYSENGIYSLNVTAESNTGETEHAQLEVAISNAEDPGCVVVDRVQIEPPYLLLSPEGTNTGQLVLRAWDRSGVEVDTVDQDMEFFFVGGSGTVASIDSEAGLVTALMAPVLNTDTPSASGSVNGIRSGNNAIIRVTETGLNFTHIYFRGDRTVLYIPENTSPFDLTAITVADQILDANELSFASQLYSFGIDPARGGTQYVIVDTTINHAACGANGNPIFYGYDVDSEGNFEGSCYLNENAAGPPSDPSYFSYFHEQGHNFTFASQGFVQIIAAYPPLKVSHLEGLASFASMWTLWNLQNCPTVLTSSTLSKLAVKEAWFRDAFEERVVNYQTTGGKNYENFEGAVLLGLLYDLFDEYGPKVWYDVFSTYYPGDEQLSCVLDSASDQAGFYAATFSASTGIDMRDRLREDFGFPIEDDNWDELMSCAEERVAARTFFRAEACAAVSPNAKFIIFKSGFEK